MSRRVSWFAAAAACAIAAIAVMFPAEAMCQDEEQSGSDTDQAAPPTEEQGPVAAKTMRNRISFGLGYHFYFGGELREWGRQPDGELPLTPAEIHWTLRDKFDLAQYHGPAIDFEYEHLIIPQFGMCWGFGLFIGQKMLDTTIEGARFEGPYGASGFYITLLAPRGHVKLGERVDLAGGVDVALLSFATYYVIDVTIDGETFQLDEQIYGFTPLYSAVVGLDVKLSRRWSLLFVNKVSYGKVEADEGNLVVGGNMTLISGAVHF